MNTLNRIARRTLLALALAPLALTSQAQTWPTQPVKLMVGFPAGTSPDLTARLLADPLSQALGQPVVVENRPGAGGNIAADIVSKSTDGHTLGLMINGNLTIAKLLNPKTPYDPVKDLAPISLIGTAPLVLAAQANASGANAAAVLATARSNGNKWNYGSPGIGTVGHIGMELLKARAGIDPVHVPYPGYPQVVTAMAAGDIHLSLLPPALAQTQANAGKIRLLGVTSSGRSALAPGVPSLSEAGVKDYNLEIWNAVAGPTNLPPAVVAKLSATIGEIVRREDIRARLTQQGWQVVGGTSEALARRIQNDTAVLGKIIADRNIKVE